MDREGTGGRTGTLHSRSFTQSSLTQVHYYFLCSETATLEDEARTGAQQEVLELPATQGMCDNVYSGDMLAHILLLQPRQKNEKELRQATISLHRNYLSGSSNRGNTLSPLVQMNSSSSSSSTPVPIAFVPVPKSLATTVPQQQ